MAFDTTRLLSQIKVKGDIPYGKFTDTEILDVAYDCLLSEIVPLIIESRQNFYVTSKDYAITANEAEYYIPARALNGVLREVKIATNGALYDLDRIDQEDESTTLTGCPEKFLIRGNYLVLSPTPSTTDGTLRVYYFIRPSKLVKTSECCIITNINGMDVTATAPSSWTTSNTFDLVKGSEHFDILQQDLVASSVGAGHIVFTSTLSNKLTVGDYVCKSGESCFPMLPVEGHVSLIYSTVASLLEAIGDPQAASVAEKARFLRESFQQILKLRVQGETNLGKRII